MCSPVPKPQDPPTDDYRYEYGNYGEYGELEEGAGGPYSEADYTGTNYDESEPDQNVSGYPAPEDTGSPEAARYDRDRSNRDPCAGVTCPEIDCPTRPYIPQGECCPVCPGYSQAPNRPNLQVSQ